MATSPRAFARPRHTRSLLAAAALLMVFATAFTSPAAASAAAPRRTATESRLAAAVASLINQERRAHHLRALHYNGDLVKSARGHDLTMARDNTMSHQLPGEAFFATRISRAGYDWDYAGENIGWNSVMTKAGVLMLEKIMYAERAPNDGHRLNILNSHYRDVGVDVYLDAKHHKVWLTTDFGRR